MADAKISALTSASTPLAGTEVLPIVQSGSTKKVTVANLTAGRGIAAADVVASGELTTTTNNARISMYRTTGTNYFDWASGQTLAFGTQTSQGGGGRVNKVNFTDAGNVEIASGNLVISTAGKGIDFSADAHATGMTSELLDDYEEGTWTPTVKGASPNGTYETTSATYGTYVKVGKIVHINCYITLAAVITGGGGAYMVIDGLPFAKIANSFSSGAFGCSGIDFDADTMWATIQFTSTTYNTGALYVAQIKDNGAAVDLPISAVAANDIIWFSLSYEAHGY